MVGRYTTSYLNVNQAEQWVYSKHSKDVAVLCTPAYISLISTALLPLLVSSHTLFIIGDFIQPRGLLRHSGCREFELVQYNT